MFVQRFVLRILVLSSLLSCAYRVGSSRSSSEELRIFMPVFENMTARPVDLNEVTSVFKKNLESVRGVSFVNSKEQANLLVLGRLNSYEQVSGPTAFKGSFATQNQGGLRENSISASTLRLLIEIELEKRTPEGERISSSKYSEQDLYELSDRLTLESGSAATPQIHASREAIMTKVLAERIARRAQSQIVDNF
jgi:hypothetical protein